MWNRYTCYVCKGGDGCRHFKRRGDIHSHGSTKPDSEAGQNDTTIPPERCLDAAMPVGTAIGYKTARNGRSSGRCERVSA